MRWIDTHVHLFSQNDSDHSGIPLVQARQEINTGGVYRDLLGGNAPEGVVVVDFSMAKDSEHVINSLDELKQKGIKAAGVIKGNLADTRTKEWMQRPDVKGIRLYARDSMPDLSGAEWQATLAEVKKNGQHVLVFGVGAFLLGLVKQIPAGIPVLVDHLGLPDLAGDDINFRALLDYAKERGHIYFKGPGYRTSLDVEKVKPLVRQIVAAVGVDYVILGASDGPFAGPVSDPSPEYAGKKFAEVMDYDKVLRYISDLATVAGDEGNQQKLLYENAKDVYGF